MTIGHEVFPIVNSSFGHVQDRSRQRTATVSFTPVGQFLSGLWPYSDKKSGDAILDGTKDYDLTIKSYKGVSVVVHNVALSKMPDLILSTTKTLAGEATFTGLGQGLPLADQTDASSFVTFGTDAPIDEFDVSTIITQPYSAKWNSGTNSSIGNNVFDSLYTVNGWHITFDMGLAPVEVDSHGIVDWTVGDVRASARAQLIGITEEEAIEAVHPNIARGGAMDVTNNLVVSGVNGIVVTLYACMARVVPAQYGLTTLRLADMEFNATRQIVDNAVQDMFKVDGPFLPF